MSRGVLGINLKVGQDFDGEMEQLMHVVEGELGDARPKLNGAFKATDRHSELKTAEHLSAHEPTNLHPDGPRWWEWAPIVSR